MKKTVIILVLVIATGILFYQNTRIEKPLTKGCTEEAKICSDGSVVGRTGLNCEFAACPENDNQLSITGPTNLDISQWQIYRNQEYGFEFKFPKEMVYSSVPHSSVQPVLVLETKSTPDPVVDGTQKFNYSLFIEIVRDQDKLRHNAESFSSTIVGGIDAQISNVYKVGDEGGEGQSVVFNRNGGWYHLQFVSGGFSPPGSFENNKLVFNKILSTFKFTK